MAFSVCRQGKNIRNSANYYYVFRQMKEKKTKAKKKKTEIHLEYLTSFVFINVS